MIKGEKIKNGLPLFAVCALTAVFFWRLPTVSAAMENALTLCAVSLIPCLFPFLLLTDILLHIPKGKKLLSLISKPLALLFRTSERGASAYLIGALFGFPLGAKALAEYYKNATVSKKEAERILLFSNNAGPAFLIGGVGYKLFGSLRLGVILYALQIFISLLIGFLSRFFAKKEVCLPTEERSNERFSFSEAMRRVVLQMLSICGYVCFFSVIGSLFAAPLSSFSLCALLYAFLEIGNAASFLSKASSLPFLPFLSFAICFSGLSVYFQFLDSIADTDLKAPYYLPIKLFSGILAFTLSLVFMNFLT